VVVRVFDIENDGFLAAVEPYEIAALAVGGPVVAAREIAFRPLDLDDPGAGIGKAVYPVAGAASGPGLSAESESAAQKSVHRPLYSQSP